MDKKIDFDRHIINKGMILRSKNVKDNSCYEFTADIQILNHSTMISQRYSPVIHCGTIRQTARIKLDALDKITHLKIGDSARVNFRFISRPEFVEEGATLFFREGTTRGVGKVISIIPLADDPDKTPAQVKKRKLRIRPSNGPTESRK